MQKWFVIQTLPHNELRAEQNLNKQGFVTFYPKFQKLIRHARKKELALRPLFPGYMFIHFDVEQTRWQKINSTYGVKRIMCSNNTPSPVPDSIMQILFEQCEDQKQAIVPLSALKYFMPGDTVTLKSGPFEGQIAVIEALKDSDRVNLLLNLLGKSVHLSTHLANIELTDRN